MNARKDWSAWHDKYTIPDSDLANRLITVRDAIRTSIPDGVATIIDICAGDARDIVSALGNYPSKENIQGVAVEISPTLAHTAEESLKNAGLNLAVLVGDAADMDVYRPYAPADLVLLCGVFGNIENKDVENIIRHLPYLCKQGGKVIWTRNRRAPDVTPWIRSIFKEVGFEEDAFIAPADNTYAVGTNTFTAKALAEWPKVHLFNFIK